MDLRDWLLLLIAPHRPGDEPVRGARLVSVSAELGLRLSFEVKGEDIHVELSPASSGVPHAARTSRLLLAYRIGRGGGAIDPSHGLALCPGLMPLIARNEDAAFARLEGVAAGARSADGSTRVREVSVEQLLEPAGSPGARYWTLSPYVGCLIGCRFCYAQTRLRITRELLGLPDVPWGSYVDVRTNAAEVLARELDTHPSRTIKFCPIVSDPYHAVEKRYSLTRSCLEVIAAHKTAPPAIVLTRSSMVERDIDVLEAMPRAYVGMSVPTHDDAIRSHFEPRAASIDDRRRTLLALRSAGIHTFAVVQPLLTDDVEGFADWLSQTVESARLDVLRGTEGAANEFADPRYSHFADPAWQDARARDLARALLDRGVTLWPDELPPALTT